MPTKEDFMRQVRVAVLRDLPVTNGMVRWVDVANALANVDNLNALPTKRAHWKVILRWALIRWLS